MSAEVADDGRDVYKVVLWLETIEIKDLRGQLFHMKPAMASSPMPRARGRSGGNCCMGLNKYQYHGALCEVHDTSWPYQDYGTIMLATIEATRVACTAACVFSDMKLLLPLHLIFVCSVPLLPHISGT